MQTASEHIRRLSRPPLLWPMLLVPYLPEDRLEMLTIMGVSALDLCGNGVVIVPGEWFVRRTGKPNLYPQSFPIKNVFRGTSSLVARVFLWRPTYDAVGEIREEIERRGGAVALSTVSKALARLEDELIVGRQSGKIRLLQPDKLLQRLVENYRPPEVRGRFVGKCDIPPLQLLGQSDWATHGTSLVVTGASSAHQYAADALEETVSVYCSDIKAVLGRLGGRIREQERFPDLELLETSEDFAYFDPWDAANCPWASPVQAYLELATGGKREQEAAEHVKVVILRRLAGEKAL